MVQNKLTTKRKNAALLSEVFITLHDEIIESFTREILAGGETLKDYQLYGFNDFSEEKPSIRNWIFEKQKRWVNGKYLYNKLREAKNGRSVIYLADDFAKIYLQLVGYKDFIHFLETKPALDDEIKSRQVALLNTDELLTETTYIGYSVGEGDTIIKSKLSIANGSGDIEWTLIYWNKEYEPCYYTHRRGRMRQCNVGNVYFFPKEYSDTGNDACIAVFTGASNLETRPYILGHYIAFDKNNAPVSGEIIFQHIEDPILADEVSLLKHTDPIIAHKLIGKRLTPHNHLPNHLYDLTPEAKFVKVLEHRKGNYSGYVLLNDVDLRSVKIDIESPDKKSTIEIQDEFKLTGIIQVLANGNIFCGSFKENNSFHEVKFYIKPEKLENGIMCGVLTGINKFNQPMVGKFLVTDETPTAMLDAYLQRSIHANPAIIGKTSTGNPLPVHHAPDHSRLNGSYKIYFADRNYAFFYEELLIISDSTATIISNQGCMTGSACFFGEGNFGVNIYQLNNTSFLSQLQVYPGRRRSEDITNLAGHFITLDEDFKPVSYKILLLPARTISSFTPKKLSLNAAGEQYQNILRELI